VSRLSEFSSEPMSPMREASQLLRVLARPRPEGESVKATLRRLHTRLHRWRYSRVRDVWYGDRSVRLRVEELDELRRLARQHRAEDPATAELRALQQRIERIEALLAANPPIDRQGDHAIRHMGRVAVRVLGAGD